MTGFVITDPAAKMAQRLGVKFEQYQADAMRRRVGELEAAVLTESAIRGLPFRVVAREWLAAVVAARVKRQQAVWAAAAGLEIIGLLTGNGPVAQGCPS